MEETNELKSQAEDFVEQDTDIEITGDINISEDVIATISGIATEEIDGVCAMYTSFAGGIAEMLGAKKSPGKGVKVDINDKNVKIDIYIVVDYGAKIPDLAWAVQENVKNNVETMTGLNVDKVNIHIEGISFDRVNADKALAEVEEIPSDGESFDFEIVE